MRRRTLLHRYHRYREQLHLLAARRAIGQESFDILQHVRVGGNVGEFVSARVKIVHLDALRVEAQCVEDLPVVVHSQIDDRIVSTELEEVGDKVRQNTTQHKQSAKTVLLRCDCVTCGCD